MTHRFRKRGAMAFGVLGLLAAPLMTGAPAAAGVVPAALAGGQAGVVCADPHDEPGAAAARRREGRGVDHAEVSSARARQLNDEVRRTQQRMAKGATPRLADRIVIDVHVHNVYGAHGGERDLGRGGADLAVHRLSEQFAGWDEPGSLATRFRFRMVSYHVVRSDRFYHAAPDSYWDRYYKRRYHRGGGNDLNLYLREAKIDGETLLGYARFPWQYARQPRLDGVTVHPESLPNRKLRAYNQGDTVTHEVGHWLGLFHVFEGDCANRDGVGDTPAQVALFECVNDDTCLLSPGRAQPFNYMQYTPDRCMQTFTPGQAARMDAAWTKWRA